jgi:T-complex protein 1 subunit theta
VAYSNKATRSTHAPLLAHAREEATDIRRSYESEDGAVLRNIEACRAIAETVQTSLGPYGRNKIVINHLQKLILTSDAATILKELDVVHPAAKLMVMASQQQEAELGDATNMVIILAGELLRKAEELLRMGLKTSDIVLGYERAQKEALGCLERTCSDGRRPRKMAFGAAC